MRKIFVSFLSLCILITVTSCAKKEAVLTIQNDKKVAIDYTLTVEGKVVDTSKGRQPLVYTQGKSEIIPGLERQLEGLKVGDFKKVSVNPEDAYGVVDPNGFQSIPKDSLPEGIEPKVGMMLQAGGPDGGRFPVTISEVKENEVVINLNHPLAGKVLDFEVTIVSIE